MYPNPWSSSVPPPAPKPIANNYENNTQPYPFYNNANAMQNITVSIKRIKQINLCV